MNADWSRMDLKGQLLAGRYRVTALLAAGGMATTYLATDERMFDRQVVVKAPDLKTADARVRFVNEARQLTELNHPHIVPVLDAGTFGDSSDGVPYVVMRYLEGGNLHERAIAAGGVQSAEEVAQWLVPIADALDFIHRKNVLHRDVKPANILFDAPGPAAHAFLADFGIAKALQDYQTVVTGTGERLGTVRYMPPEAWIGQRGPAWDQYSLACTVFEALSGELPHIGETDEKRQMQKLTKPARSVRDVAPQVPAAVAQALARALERDPDRRYDSCSEFARAFQSGVADIPSAAQAVPTRSALTGDSGTVGPPLSKPAFRPLSRGGSGRRTALILGAAGLIAAFAGLAVLGRNRPLSKEAGSDLRQSSGDASAPKGSVPVGGSTRGQVSAPTPPDQKLASSQTGSESKAEANSKSATPDAVRYTAASLKATCSTGDGDSCLRLALRDDFRMVALLQTACEMRSWLGCTFLAAILVDGGPGIQKDVPRALKLLEQACENEVGVACVDLGDRFFDGDDVKEDKAKYRELYTRAAVSFRSQCLDGDWQSCARSSDFHFRDNEGLSSAERALEGSGGKRAETLGEEACSRGDVDACRGLAGWLESTFKPVPADQVISLLKRGCDGDEPHSCAELGALALTGNSRDGWPIASQVAPDVPRANALLTKGCETGAAEGCEVLARLFDDGKVVQRDVSRSLSLRVRACDGLRVESCVAAGRLLESGAPGAPRDLTRARALYSRACVIGSAEACQLANR